MASQRASLDLTNVVYEPSSHVSFSLALVTLSPILIMPAYASAAIFTRELLVFEMWIGQFANEGFNYILKSIIKQDRPQDSAGTGYGFPSSHCQYMGYFASFLICHLYFRHRFHPTEHPTFDLFRRWAHYVIVIVWAAAVCYSRLHLTYHSLDQVAWGAAIGVFTGTSYYLVIEMLPIWYPRSALANIRHALVSSTPATALRIRDSWSVWDDAGTEEEYQAWRRKWQMKQHYIKKVK